MGKFGWSYPPGVSKLPWDENEPPCEVCCKDPADCICAECNVCGAQGAAKCYRGHGLKLTREQVISRVQARIANLQDLVNEEKQALSIIEDGGLFSDDINDYADPWL